MITSVLLLVALAADPAAFSFSITAPKEQLATPFSGRVVVFASRAGRGEPRNGPNWFRPEPMFAADFADIAPGAAMTIDATNWIPFPRDPATLESAEYSLQAVIDLDLGGRTIGGSAGNLYSAVVKAKLDPTVKNEVAFTCDKVVAARAFKETDRVKELRVESKLLSKFYGRPTTLNGAVCLPEDWAKEPERKFPVYYSVPGFGGSHANMSGRNDARGTDRDGESFIMVALDPSCPGGHSVFADSANNGPWGQALVEEFIPECEKRFRGIGEPSARFVGGHSSGGWSSLWLQVTYPETFGGCWSTSPDPVDFRDFQQINIYRDGENMFVDPAGQDRPLARRGDQVAILYRDFSDMERPLRGEQLGSFDWVFSPRGEDGKPLPLWDRITGAIDPKVAEAWKPYDIGLTLRTRWQELAPRLAGKIHVYMGTEDTFYLEGAVELLKQDLTAIGADAVVELFPGDHGSVMTPALLERIDREMAEQFRSSRVAK
jgi:S-formylglutathione hydrolase FrmB